MIEFRCRRVDRRNRNTPIISDKESAFVTAFNRVFDCRDEIINTLETIINETLSGNKTESAIKKLHDELEVIELKTKALIDRNTKTVLNQEEYNRQYDTLAEKYKPKFP